MICLWRNEMVWICGSIGDWLVDLILELDVEDWC